MGIALAGAAARCGGRFRSCVLQEKAYVLACYRYIELSPVRAGRVTHSEDYRWSSYRVNARGESGVWLTPQLIYQALGTDQERRCVAHRELSRYESSF